MKPSHGIHVGLFGGDQTQMREAEWKEVLHDVLAIGGLPTPLEKRWRV